MSREQLVWIEYMPTSMCNARNCNPGPGLRQGKPGPCVPCYQADDQPITPEAIKHTLETQLTTEEVFKLIDEIVASGIHTLYFLGGEPLFRPDAGKIIEYAAEKIPFPTLSTNGVFVEQYLGVLKKLPGVEVSLDASDLEIASQTRAPYLVQKANEAINLLTEAGVYTSVNVSLSRNNAHIILASIRDFFSRGVKQVNLYPTVVIREEDSGLALTPEEFQRIGGQIMDNFPVFLQTYCKAGLHLNITENGIVTPCAKFLGEKELPIGDIRKQSLKEIMSHPVLQKLQEYDFVKPPSLEAYHAGESCPGFHLVMNDWKSPEVRKRVKVESEIEELFCLRCKRPNPSNVTNCSHCDFDHFFTGEAVFPACNAFIVYLDN